MPTMIEKVAEAILDAKNNHPYERSDDDVKKDGIVVFIGTEKECIEYMEGEISKLYARAAIEAMKQPDGAMLWVRSKGYDAMIEAALK